MTLLRRTLIRAVVLLGALAVLAPATGSANVTWPSGVFAGYGPQGDREFATWRGRPIDTATDFLPGDTWANMENPKWAIAMWSTASDIRPVFSTALWPASGGSLAQAASGAYNDHFRAMARNLVAGGLGTSVIRLGWEFNGTWYRWSVRTKTDAKNFARAWRQIVGAMRSVPGQRFGFTWAPTIYDGGLDPALSYPGDAYVTDIGLTTYDWNAKAGQTPAQRWSSRVTARYGLAWQAKFAAAHHRPISFPEWGLVFNANDPAAGGGDDPLFIQNMHDWFASHSTAYENYFDADAGSVFYGIRTGSGRFPNGAALYQQLWSATG